MSTKFTDLHCKEVICVSDGRRLGYIADACVEIPTGNIVSIVVPGPCRFFGLFGRKDDYIIPWSRICRMGRFTRSSGIPCANGYSRPG